MLGSMKKRTAKMDRKTTETGIVGQLTLDGSGTYRIETGIPFFNHMLDLLTKHALFDLTLEAKGDLAVDYHHTVEDVGLALGEALNRALGDRKGIARYGYSMLPMDDALAQVAVDLGGRPYLVYRIANKKKKIRDFDVSILEHFFRSFADQARLNLHITQPYGDDVHHAYEAVFKGVARALYMACALDPRVRGVPSSKDLL
jgi:imidazoleglycerol-phosphate dehydratase